MPENFKVADFKEVKFKVAIDSMGKAKVYVLKENGGIYRNVFKKHINRELVLKQIV